MTRDDIEAAREFYADAGRSRYLARSLDALGRVWAEVDRLEAAAVHDGEAARSYSDDGRSDLAAIASERAIVYRVAADRLRAGLAGAC